MRKLKAPFLAVILLLNVSLVMAQPPVPGGGGTETLPIDQNIVFLAIGGLILGIAVIYKSKIKKASV